MNIIFFGTPEFSAIILKKLIQTGMKPVLVVTAPDKPIGRKQTLTPPEVKTIAEKYRIPVVQPETLENPDFKTVFRNCQPDLVIVAAFGPPFLTKEFLEASQYGCLNIHPSLLPKYRGASPIPHAILNGETATGATIIRMAEKIDQGDILNQEKIDIMPEDTTFTLTKKLADLSAGLLVKTIAFLVEGKLSPRPQGQSPTLYCYQLKKEQGKIDWSHSAEFIERQVRAFDPWPGTYCRWQMADGRLKTLKILETEVLSGGSDKQSGEVFLAENGELAIKTGQNCLIVKKLQLEGGKSMAAEEFIRGHREIIGAILE